MTDSNYIVCTINSNEKIILPSELYNLSMLSLMFL